MLGSYTTNPKAPRGGSIDREKSFFLNILHFDIAFSSCVLVGGFCYSLIFVDRATRYNWVFGLKDLSKESILLAYRLFRVDAGSYARCFHCDCDPKLFGTTIREHLVDHSCWVGASLPTVLWNSIGKSWSTWLGLTLWKSRCLGLFGSMQCHTQPE